MIALLCVLLLSNCDLIGSAGLRVAEGHSLAQLRLFSRAVVVSPHFFEQLVVRYVAGRVFILHHVVEFHGLALDGALVEVA